MFTKILKIEIHNVLNFNWVIIFEVLEISLHKAKVFSTGLRIIKFFIK